MISRQQEIRRNRLAMRALSALIVMAVVLALFALLAPPSRAATPELCMGKPLPAGQQCYRISPIEMPGHVRPYRPCIRPPHVRPFYRWYSFTPCRLVWHCPKGKFCALSRR